MLQLHVCVETVWYETVAKSSSTSAQKYLYEHTIRNVRLAVTNHIEIALQASKNQSAIQLCNTYESTAEGVDEGKLCEKERDDTAGNCTTSVTRWTCTY